jgi:hypothetical protein
VRIPVVLLRDEVARLLANMPEGFWLIGALLNGAGLRLNECLRLRVKDVDFDRRAAGANCKESDRAHVSPFVRNAPARFGCRHTASARVVRTLRREYNNDLHACLKSSGGWSREPTSHYFANPGEPRAIAQVHFKWCMNAF